MKEPLKCPGLTEILIGSFFVFLLLLFLLFFLFSRRMGLIIARSGASGVLSWAAYTFLPLAWILAVVSCTLVVVLWCVWVCVGVCCV